MGAFLHEETTATATRPPVNGDVMTAETALGTPTVAVEDVTSKIRRQPGGADVKLALRLWTEDMTAYQPRDRFALTHRGEAASLLVDDAKAYPDADPPHQQILVIQRMDQRLVTGAEGA